VSAGVAGPNLGIQEIGAQQANAALAESVAAEGTVQVVVEFGTAGRADRSIQRVGRGLQEDRWRGRVSAGEIRRREEGLQLWLDSRDERREKNPDEVYVVRDGQDCPSYDGALDDAFAALSVELIAIV
jgi:hypothetical protein